MLRRSRLTRNGAWLMLPMDHGFSMGAQPGLHDIPRLLDEVSSHATCVTVHRGLLPAVAPYADRLGIMLHLSASTDCAPDPTDKRLVATVEEAVRRGCDGVSLHVNIGSLTEAHQLEDAGKVAGLCDEWGMPLVAMIYPRGPGMDSTDPKLVAHAVRVGYEIGATAVKVPFTSDFEKVVAAAPLPVLVAGGADGDIIKIASSAKAAGAKGVSVGRNVFGHANPGAIMAELAKVFA